MAPKNGLSVSLFGNFVPDCPDTFETVRTLSKLSRCFPDCPDTFQTVRTISRLYGHFLLTGHFPDCPDTFYIVRTVFRLSRHFPVTFKHFCVQCAKPFQTHKNFPGSNATTLPTFFCL